MCEEEESFLTSSLTLPEVRVKKKKNLSLRSPLLCLPGLNFLKAFYTFLCEEKFFGANESLGKFPSIKKKLFLNNGEEGGGGGGRGKRGADDKRQAESCLNY